MKNEVLIPLGATVLIQLDPYKKVSEGGIHLPDTDEMPRYWTGVILAKGDDAKGGPQPGHRVMWCTPPLLELNKIGQVIVAIEDLLVQVQTEK